jgi:riboflavin synthase
MFTGIVEAVGEVAAVDDAPDGRRLRLDVPFAEELQAGASLCVSGACLTVERGGPGWIEVFLSAETVDRTTLGALDVGDGVNLERALAAHGRFDGHVVQGHVDDTAAVVDVRPVGDDWTFVFELPDHLDRYVVEKGSIAVDGISLTVADLTDESCSVAIIPETYRQTTLGETAVGDPVHLEADVLAKYVERQLAAGAFES